MSSYLTVRCVTHEWRDCWSVQARVYGDTWSTVMEGGLFECARHASWLAGLTPLHSWECS